MTRSLVADQPWAVPASWEWAYIGDVAEVIGGGTPRTGENRYFDGGTIPWITPADLSGYNEKHIYVGRRNITEAGLNSCGARMLPAGAVLFSSRAPVGYVAIATVPLCTNQGFKSFVFSDAILPDYAYYYLQRARGLALQLASGTTFPEISGANAARIPIPIAPKPEQSRIVSKLETLLSMLDNSVTVLEHAKRNLKAYTASVLKAACAGRLLQELVRSDSASTDWRTVPVGRVLEEPLANGRSPAKSGTGTRILRLTAIRRHVVDFSQTRFGSVSANDREKLVLRAGDVLVSRGNGSRNLVGRAALVTEQLPRDVILPDTMIRIRLAPQSFDPRYFVHVWNSPFVRAQIERAAKTTAGIYKISQQDIKKFVLSCPPVHVQHAIVEEIERHLSVATQLEREIETALRSARGLRAVILRCAFEGTLVPQDPADEPASILIDRLLSERAMSEKERSPARAKHRATAAAYNLKKAAAEVR